MGTAQKKKKVEMFTRFENSPELKNVYDDECSDTDDSTVASDDGELEGMGGWVGGDLPAEQEPQERSDPPKCSGFTLDSISSSSRLSDERKADVTYGFKHLVREGYVSKANMLHPADFRWDDEAYCGADGVITTGIQARVDWTVHVPPPLDEEYRWATIRDVDCAGEAKRKAGVCDKCQKSRQTLICRCTQTADIRRKPLNEFTKNSALVRTPSLINKKLDMVSEKLHKLRSSYRGKVYRKMSSRGGVDVKLNAGVLRGSAVDVLWIDRGGVHLPVGGKVQKNASGAQWLRCL